VQHQAHAVQVFQAMGFGFVLAAAQHLDLGQCQVFGHAQVRKQLEILKHHAHPRAQLGQVGLGIMHSLAVDKNLAFLERLKGVDHLDQRGFAGARRTADHDHFAFFDIGAAVVEHLHIAVPLRNFFHLNHFSLQCSLRLYIGFAASGTGKTLSNDGDFCLQAFDEIRQPKTHYKIDHGS